MLVDWYSALVVARQCVCTIHISILTVEVVPSSYGPLSGIDVLLRRSRFGLASTVFFRLQKHEAMVGE